MNRSIHLQALGDSYDMLVLHLTSLAGVYRSLKLEVTKAIQFDHGNGADDDDDQEMTTTRFVEGELLDSSVYGIQPEHVVHQSGSDLMANMFSRLDRVVSSAERLSMEDQPVYEEISTTMDDDEISVLSNLERLMDRIHVHESKQLYRHLARECATILGDMWLIPRLVSLPETKRCLSGLNYAFLTLFSCWLLRSTHRAEGVVAKVNVACEWYVKSDTSAETLCAKLLPLWEEKKKENTGDLIARPLLAYIEKALSGGHDDEDRSKRDVVIVSDIAGGGKDALWERVVHFVHEAEGPRRLEWLILQSRLSWGHLPQARQTAKQLLLSQVENGQKVTHQKALLALAVYDLASAVEGQVTVQLDNSRNNAWVEVPGGMEGPVGIVTTLTEGVPDEDVKQACLRAPETIIKHLVMQVCM